MLSFNEVRLDVVKMEDEGLGMGFVSSSFESFGNGKEKKWVRCSPFSSEWVSSQGSCIQIDEVTETESESREPTRRPNSSWVPTRLS